MKHRLILAVFFTIVASGCINTAAGPIQNFQEYDRLNFSNGNMTMTVDRPQQSYSLAMKISYSREKLTSVPGKREKAASFYSTQICSALQQKFFKKEKPGNMKSGGTAGQVTVTDMETGETIKKNYRLDEKQTIKVIRQYSPSKITARFQEIETGNTTRQCEILGPKPGDMITNFQIVRSGSSV